MSHNEERLELNKVLQEFALEMRRKVVRRLMEGNDTGCFNTEQYMEMYAEIHTPPMIGINARDFYNKVVGEGWGRVHLESLKEVQEVRRNIWTLEMKSTSILDGS